MKVAWILLALLLACSGCTSVTSESQQQVEEDQAKKNCGRAMTQRSKCKDA
jgi:cytochrome c556